MTESSEQAGRSYGCTFGDGNPYDFVLIDIASGATEFVCLPCLVRLAGDMVEAVTNGDNPALREAMAFTAANPQEQPPGPRGRKRGKNAPVNSGDPNMFEAFDASAGLDML